MAAAPSIRLSEIERRRQKLLIGLPWLRAAWRGPPGTRSFSPTTNWSMVRGLAEYTPFARKSAVSKQTSGLPPEPAARRWKRLLCGVAARRASASPPENCDLVELLRASSVHA